jgi:tetratricopeptide (TPR) repeat protein
MGFSGVPSPSERVLQTLRQRRALFAGDFEFLERSLSAERQQALSSEEGSIGYAPLVHSLEETALAGIDRCQEWLQTIPDSYLAHWICAEIWNDGAWEARSGGYMSEINIAQSVLMTERLLESNRLLERAIVLDERPVEALTLLAHNHSLLGTRLAEDESLWSRVASLLTSDDQDTLDDLPHPRITSLAARYHAQAVELYPRYLPAHRNWVNFLQPKWGGSQGLVQEAIEQAQHAGIAQGDLHDMRDEFIVSPTSFASPGATRAYWENAIDQQPTFRRLEGLMHDLAGLENWKAMIPVAERIIASYPDESGAYFWLAEAKKMTGKIDEAQAAHLYAAAMGHDGAIQEVIMAFIRGGLGVDDGYAGPGLPELCQYSAALGSPIGANCLGAGYFEGGQPGVPFARDPAQGYAWHLLGSRAGHYNSQFDLGWMLYTGRVPGVDREMAQELGIFWLRRAEEKGHMFASRRLDEMGIDRSKAPSSEDNLLMLSNSLKTALASLRQQLRNLLV